MAAPLPGDTPNAALIALARRLREVMISLSAEAGDEADMLRQDIETVLADVEGA